MLHDDEVNDLKPLPVVLLVVSPLAYNGETTSKTTG